MTKVVLWLCASYLGSFLIMALSLALLSLTTADTTRLLDRDVQR